MLKGCYSERNGILVARRSKRELAVSVFDKKDDSLTGRYKLQEREIQLLPSRQARNVAHKERWQLAESFGALGLFGEHSGPTINFRWHYGRIVNRPAFCRHSAASFNVPLFKLHR